MSAAAELQALLELMQTLRDPQRGCPWDRAQSFESLAPYALEEAYELADAIARADAADIRDELGDLLFQVVFHAQLAQERQWFDFASVARALREKLIRRHPHVFAPGAGEGESADAGAGAASGTAALQAAWDAHKARERAGSGARGALSRVPLALPALTRAAKLGRRAARVGFDWPDAAGVRAKLDEELGELDAALASGQGDRCREELGDLLFTIANWARHLHIDPEEALRAAAGKFERRFARMEQAAAARGARLESLSAAQWDALWEASKSAEPR